MVPPLSGELVLTFLGIVIGIGIAWGTQGAKLNALKEALGLFRDSNSREHEVIRGEMGEFRVLERRVSRIEGHIGIGAGAHPRIVLEERT